MFDPSLLELRSLVDSVRAISASLKTEHFSDNWVTSEILITTIRAIDSVRNRGASSGGSSPEPNPKPQSIDIDRPPEKQKRRNDLSMISTVIISSVVFVIAWLIWWQSTKERRDRNQEIKQVSIQSIIQPIDACLQSIDHPIM